METQKATFRLNNYRISKSSIEVKDSHQKDEIKISVSVSGKIKKNAYWMTMAIELKNDKETLSINVVSESEFEFNEDIDREMLSAMCTKNAPAIILPYIRAYIGCLTALTEINAIMIPTINLSAMGDSFKENISGLQPKSEEETARLLQK
jgi:preprotein translocase subunit SecB